MSSDSSGQNHGGSAVEPDIVERFQAIRRRSWGESLLDWLYGYDYFISYRWKDGRIYSEEKYWN